MAIAIYDQLVQAIQDWMMNRTDLAVFAPDCIQLAESYFNYGGDWNQHDRPLRCRQMEQVAIITPDENGIYLLPDDFLQIRRISESSQSPRRSLSFIEPVVADVWYSSRQGGMGDNFTIIGNAIHGFPNSSQTVELIYYAKIPPLAPTNPVNWLLAANPNIYLYGSLMMAADKIKFQEEIEKYATLLRGFVSGMNDTDMLGRMARAGLSLRGPCP